MPNNKQAAKRLRQAEKSRQLNKRARSSMRTAMKQVLAADSTEAAEKALPLAMKRIDKAAKRHIIHANAAARLKGRMARVAATR